MHIYIYIYSYTKAKWSNIGASFLCVPHCSLIASERSNTVIAAYNQHQQACQQYIHAATAPAARDDLCNFGCEK